MKRVAVIALIAMAVAVCSACSDLGRTVGKVGAKLEQNVDAFGEGYEQGRAEEMKKNAPSPAAPSTPSNKPGAGAAQTPPKTI